MYIILILLLLFLHSRLICVPSTPYMNMRHAQRRMLYHLLCCIWSLCGHLLLLQCITCCILIINYLIPTENKWRQQQWQNTKSHFTHFIDYVNALKCICVPAIIIIILYKAQWTKLFISFEFCLHLCIYYTWLLLSAARRCERLWPFP